MSATVPEESRFQQFIQNSILWIFAISLTLGLTLIFSFNVIAPISLNVVVGLPAPEDIFSPRGITYESEVALKQAQAAARDNVLDFYVRMEEDVGRAQLNKVAQTFTFIEVIRGDSQASLETKIDYLLAIDSLNLEESIALDLLNMNNTDFDGVRIEVGRIVGDIMLERITEGDVRNLQQAAQRDVSLSLTPTQERVVKFIVPRFIVPNMEPDLAETERLREEAAAAVEPYVVNIAQDQLLVREGDIVTDRDIEKLQQLGLLQRETNWRVVAGIFIVSLLSSILISLYWYQFYHGRRQGNGRYLTALAALILVFALMARLMMATPNLLAYLYPMAAMSLLLSVLFDVRLAVTITVILAAMLGYNAPNSLELAMFTAAGGLLAVLTLRDTQRINAFFRAGVAAAIGYAVIIVAFQFNKTIVDIVPMFEMLAYSLANGLLSAALTLVGFFLMGSLFGVTTTLQLQELARFDHPLLQELLRRAPGTYHHSIMVANLAEQAADQIKANSTLIRVGAFYHDIGKMNRPAFFAENQEGVNPHDSLDPYTSARIILSHVTDGLDLARQYKIPDRIRDFISEHHGQRLVKGFYHKACEMSEDPETVDPEQFRYAGPRPRSRETGIVMLADVIESTSRALQPNSEKAIEKLVNTLIDEDLTEGQLDDSGLTLGDIRQIRASFIKTLKGRFHVRVKYPGNEELEIEEAEPIEAEDEVLDESILEEDADEIGSLNGNTAVTRSEEVVEPLERQAAAPEETETSI